MRNASIWRDITSFRKAIKINGRVFIHSIHSQVPSTVEALCEDFDLIVSMDSHLDWKLGIDNRFYPDELQQIAARTTAHTDIKRLTGGLPLFGDDSSIGADFIIVISQEAFEQHKPSLPPQFGNLGIEDFKRWLKKYLGMGIYLSPPKTLKKLYSVSKEYGSILLDIDIDYIKEAQGECYTAVLPESTHLQPLFQVLRFIKKTKPAVITLSEAKLSAMRNPRSSFNSLVDSLREFGYEIIEADLVDSDEEVFRGIKDNALYYVEWTQWKKDHKLDIPCVFESPEKIKETLEQEKDFAQNFFKTLGYSRGVEG